MSENGPKVVQAPVIAWRDAWSTSFTKSVGGHWSQFPSAALFDVSFTAQVLNSSKEHESPLAWSCFEAPSPVSKTVHDVHISFLLCTFGRGYYSSC